MALTVTHTYVSEISEDPDSGIQPGLVGPNEWNADHVVSGTPDGTRTVLTADQNYYVATTGSDSNPGTITQPWATPQHAESFIESNLDLAGFTAFVNVAAGSYVGFDVNQVTSGTIQYYGAGSGSTTLTGPNAFGAVVSMDTAMTAQVGLNGFTLAPVSDGSIVSVFQTGLLQLFDITGNQATDIAFDFTGTTGVVAVQTFSPSSVIFTDLISVVGGSASAQNFFQMVAGYIIQDNNITFSGSISFSSFAAVTAGGELIGNPSTTIGGGTVTGQRFSVNAGSAISAAGSVPGALGLNFFPGNMPGVCDGSSGYDGYLLAQTTQGGSSPTTSDLVDSGAWGVFTDGSGNYWAAVNAAGTIKKVALV